jgi:hypothetical protein
MTKLAEVLVALIQDHEIVEPKLEKAMDAAFHLCLDPVGPRAERDCQEAYRFVFQQVLPHLLEEERRLFPAAREGGLHEENIFLLEQDHGGLRTLAGRLKHGGLTEDATGLSGETAIQFSRFVEATRWHMAREESIFHEILAEERRGSAPTDPPPTSGAI